MVKLILLLLLVCSGHSVDYKWNTRPIVNSSVFSSSFSTSLGIKTTEPLADIDVRGTSRFGGETSHISFDGDGFVTLKGEARAYDDLLFPALSLKIGPDSPPGFTAIQDDGSGSQGVYTYCYSSTSTEQQYYTFQFPHEMDFVAGEYEHHIHTIPSPGNPGTGTEKAVWCIEESIQNIGSAFSTTTTTCTTVTVSTTDYMHEYNEMESVSSVGLSSSTIGMARIYRCHDCAEDNYPHDHCLLQTDIHYIKNSFGQKINGGL